MDFQHRVGGKTGSGGPLSQAESNAERRERLRKLAAEYIDLTKDPYFMKNHLGTYECRLCLTLHNNEGSYLAHTQGKKHQANLGRRAAKEAAQSGLASFNAANAEAGPSASSLASSSSSNSSLKKKNSVPKIGRPGYKIHKIRDPITRYLGLIFQIFYPQLLLPTGIECKPRYRLMSSFEQKKEAPNKNYQYLLIAAEPYETIAFKIPNKEIDNMVDGKVFSHWDIDSGVYFVQIIFRTDI